MRPSAQHNGWIVSLWIQPLVDGRVQVDAIIPIDGYKVLFKERFATARPAIAFWRAHYLELFGIDPMI
jgi:hypothetical protein